LCYYNTGNYATIEDRARMIIRLNMKCWARIFISGIFVKQVRTERASTTTSRAAGGRPRRTAVWWRNQGILGVGNRHDNIDPSFYYCAYTNTKCVERDQKSGYYNHTKTCGSSPKRY